MRLFQRLLCFILNVEQTMVIFASDLKYPKKDTCVWHQTQNTSVVCVVTLQTPSNHYHHHIFLFLLLLHRIAKHHPITR